MIFGLKEELIYQLHQIFVKFPEVQKVIIYGSRAKGNFRFNSDVDLVLFGEYLTENQLSLIDCEIDDLLSPYKFDLSIFQHIDNQNLLDHISRRGYLFYSPLFAQFLLVKKELEQHNYDFFNVNIIDSLTASLHLLGEVCAEIRDQLVWKTLSKVVYSDQLPSDVIDRWLRILNEDDFLFKDIEAPTSDSSAKRSFAVLMVASIIFADTKSRKMITTAQLEFQLSILERYLDLELDERGFDERLGWVHCYAHLADALFAISIHPHANDKIQKKIIHMIRLFIEKRGQNVFRWDEHARLARALGHALLTDLSQNQIKEQWTIKRIIDSPFEQNAKNLLRCILLEFVYNHSDLQDNFNWLKTLTT